MKYGMSSEQFEILNRLVIQPLKGHGASVFISSIKEHIEESRFPFAVDLVNESELAESYEDSVKSQMVEL